MTTLYQLDRNGWFTGTTTAINEDVGFIRGPNGWTEVEPPHLADGEFAVFASNEWVITTNPSPVLVEPEVETPPQAPVTNEAPVVL